MRLYRFCALSFKTMFVCVDILLSTILFLCPPFSQHLLMGFMFIAQQLSITSRPHKTRLYFSPIDKAVLVLIAAHLSQWERLLQVVQPATLVKWQKKMYASYWSYISRKKKRGRPRIPQEIINLIRQMHIENSSWGAVRIWMELCLLGYEKDVSITTVKNYLKREKPRSLHKKLAHNWMWFLKSHLSKTVAVDFFTQTVSGFKNIYCFVILSHDRRRIVYCNTTQHPSQQWTIQQIREAFPYVQLPQYLIHDNGPQFEKDFRRVIKHMNAQPKRTSPKSPWQNCYCERVIGTIKRECLDHHVFLNEEHLKTILNQYIEYYNSYRPHRAFGNSPIPRHLQSPSEGRVIAVPVLGGLHHYYKRAA